MQVFSGTIDIKVLKFLHISYESFDCDLTKGFLLFMVSIDR